jgi:hypothetical protein
MLSMGILSCLEPPQRLALPDSPPELLKTLGSSSYSSRPVEQSTWLPAPPLSPPMSNYDQASNSDMSTGKGPEESRRDASQPPPRQQLPSLSSLFGPPPPARTLHSPLSADRPKSYTTTSPLDRPLGPPLERSYSSSSYFPPASTSSPSTSQPRGTYDPRHESTYPPLAGTSRPVPLSPRSRELERGGPPPRSDYGSAGRWPPPPEAGRVEYGPGSREPMPFKAPLDRYPPPLAGQKHEHEPSMYHRPPHGNLPPTPSSAVAPEGIPVKDGLGPKIWTGTHFLPRFVRAAEVPGEGMCYFYDDGSHCKSVIDGEAVNAHWGVTKAGKPRKRLAIACVTCREKKIKCDPDYPRCVQCEKFGRICKFKNA